MRYIEKIIPMIKSLLEFEDGDLLGDLEVLGFENYKGWILVEIAVYDGVLSHEILAVTATDIEKAVEIVLAHHGIEDKEIDAVGDFNIDVSDRLNDLISPDDYYFLETVYDGLIPVKRKNEVKVLTMENPLESLNSLRKIFSNVDQVLSSPSNKTHYNNF